MHLDSYIYWKQPSASIERLHGTTHYTTMIATAGTMTFSTLKTAIDETVWRRAQQLSATLFLNLGYYLPVATQPLD
jgi:hypothetical protein